MARTNEQVAHLFAHRQAGDSNNMHSDGTELKSYSTVIAVWYGNVCFASSDSMSATTGSKHLSPLRKALRGQRMFSTPAFSWGRYGAPTVAECLQEAAKEMESLFKTLCRSRVNLDHRITYYEARRQEILQFAAEFGVDVPAMPEATGDLKEKAKQFAAQDKERRAEERKRQEERERAQRIEDAGSYDLWTQFGRGRFPQSYSRRITGTDSLTLKNGREGIELNRAADTVITSQGAEVPLDHVRKAVEFYQGRQRRSCPSCGALNRMNYEVCACGTALAGATPAFVAYHTNGHKVRLGAFVLDSIDEQGNVTAGCHRFTAAEIARFIEQWQEVL